MLLRLLVTGVALFPTFVTAALRVPDVSSSTQLSILSSSRRRETEKTCVASSTEPDPGEVDGTGNELFYCINGGTAGGTPGNCTCTSCNEGFGGPHCGPPCVASSDESLLMDPDADLDGNYYCINGGTAGGYVRACTCTDCNEGFGGLYCDPPCTASTSAWDEHIPYGEFYCINGGTAGGFPGWWVTSTEVDCSVYSYSTDCFGDCAWDWGTNTCAAKPYNTGSCTCTSCNVGFGGSHCELPACVARDEEADEDAGEVYCINGGTAGGFAGDCTCTGCDPGFSGPNCATTSSPTPSPTTASNRAINNIEELYNKVSSNGGNSIMQGGDTVELATGEYKCSDAEGLCKNDVYGTATVLFLENLHGAIKCENDDASYCVLDGESGWTPESGWTKRRIMTLKSTAGLKLTISAITFKDGTAAYGGGMYIYDANVNLDLEFCHFINCKADATAPINSLSPRNGGGAIYVEHNLVTVNVYGSIFTGNTADSGHGGDVFRNPSEYNSEGATAYPVFTFHNTCPSPYSAISPVMLEEGVDVYSYEDLDYNFGYADNWVCAPTRSPTLSPTQSPTSSPTTSPTASPVEDEEVPAESDLDGAGVAAFKANVFISLVGAVAGAAAANVFA